jgi:hypothetical protein
MPIIGIDLGTSAGAGQGRRKHMCGPNYYQPTLRAWVDELINAMSRHSDRKARERRRAQNSCIGGPESAHAGVARGKLQTKRASHAQLGSLWQ